MPMVIPLIQALVAFLLILAPGYAATPRNAYTTSNLVLQHHDDESRTGLFIVPRLTYQRAQRLHRDPRFHAELAGPVYAQPLYWHAPDSNKAMLIVATEQNLVYALDADTGDVVWKMALGKPVPLSTLRCGNIDPLGITGTPVIDRETQTLYLDAMSSQGNSPAHLVYALSLRDGSVKKGWPIDVAAALKAQGKTFIAADQNQRGALTILDNTVYVPYGGHFGDCGTYHGWVIGISLSQPSSVRSWSTRGPGGGVWAPGGISSDGRALYVATGNTLGARTWSGGQAVIRLPPNLAFSGKTADYFAPPDWPTLDKEDADLGGTNPLPFTLQGADPSTLILALGKDGKAYLLNRQNFGGIGGSLLARRVSSTPIRTSPAMLEMKDGVLIAFQGSGTSCPSGKRGDLTALKIALGSSPFLETAWCAEEHGRGSPIITTTDGSSNAIVWAVGAEGDNRLHGFRANTGEVIFGGGGEDDAMSLVRRFQTIIAAGGHLYVAADSRLYAFAF